MGIAIPVSGETRRQWQVSLAPLDVIVEHGQVEVRLKIGCAINKIMFRDFTERVGKQWLAIHSNNFSFCHKSLIPKGPVWIWSATAPAML